MSRLKNIVFSMIAITLFFALAEGIGRFFAFPGSYDFIERCTIEQKLARHKNKNEFRVFLFGESTMQGHYLYPYSTIDKWIKLYLKDLLPESVSNRVTVTNFGRIGSGSRFVTNAFMETIRYRPDLAVFYTAHNDFCLFGNRREHFARKSLKDRFEEFGKELPKHSAFLNAFNRLVIRSKIKRNRIRNAKSNKLDSWYTEEEKDPEIREEDILYTNTNSQKFNILKNSFENNIKGAIDFAGRHSVPVIFLESAAKWKGYEPLKSIHGTSVTKDSLAQWTRISAEAEDALARKSYDEALRSYERCLETDPLYALTYYRIGECYEGLGEFKKANEFYFLANENDRFPIRAPSSVNLFYESLRGREAEKIFIIPTQELFESRSPNGIVDDSLVGDQLHPTIDGQALIALEIVRVIYEKELLVPKKEWRWDRLRSAEAMKKDLKLDKNGELEAILAIAGYVKRDLTKAADFLEKAAAMKPDSVFVNSWLARTYWKRGEKAKALILYRQLYKDAPDMTAKFMDRHPEIKRELGI